jgi:hypothetical protein
MSDKKPMIEDDDSFEEFNAQDSAFQRREEPDVEPVFELSRPSLSLLISGLG